MKVNKFNRFARLDFLRRRIIFANENKPINTLKPMPNTIGYQSDIDSSTLIVTGVRSTRDIRM